MEQPYLIRIAEMVIKDLDEYITGGKTASVVIEDNSKTHYGIADHKWVCRNIKYFNNVWSLIVEDIRSGRQYINPTLRLTITIKNPKNEEEFLKFVIEEEGELKKSIVSKATEALNKLKAEQAEIKRLKDEKEAKDRKDSRERRVRLEAEKRQEEADKQNNEIMTKLDSWFGHENIFP